MKKLITLILTGGLAFFGATVDVEARPHHGYHAPASTVYVSGYRHGRPIYTEKYVVGHDRWGRPIFRYRTITPAGHSYRVPRHHNYCPPAYSRGYHRNAYYHNRGHYSSGTRVTFSFSR